MPDRTDREMLEEIVLAVRRINERQKLTAKSVGDLSVGLSAAQIASRNRDGETHGLILGLRSEITVGTAVRERKNSEDQTDSFKLPGSSGDKIELTRRTQKKLIRWVLLALCAIALHAAQFVWERAAEHRQNPSPPTAPAPTR